MDNDFALGTIVKNKDGRVGVVVPDMPNPICAGMVPVDYGTFGLEATDAQDLETVGAINIRIDLEKCKDCIFSNGKICLRYEEGRHFIVYGRGFAGNGYRIPDKNFPDCQSAQRAVSLQETALFIEKCNLSARV